MSELISGKEALIALANGEDVEYEVVVDGVWKLISSMSVNLILNDNFRFRLKPRTITLNGIDVGLLVSSQWTASESNKVKLEFNSKEEAHYFYTKAMEIFNTKKGSEND